MNLSVGAKTDPGRRANNEDQLAVVDVRRHRLRADGVLVIADGMGGRNFGERAAAAAVQTVQDTLVEMLDADRPDAVNVGDALDSALRKANARVYEVAAQTPESRGMGTTCVAAVVEGDRLFLAHAGDSRAYLLRGQQLVRLTDDHSYVAEQVRAGTLTEENARRSRFRNVITRAIGIEPTITPDLSEHDIQSGDWVLLCTDGLSNMVADPEMVQTLVSASSAQDAADRLVQIAARNGGRDNITAIAARVEPGNRTQRMRKSDLARVLDGDAHAAEGSSAANAVPSASAVPNGGKAGSAPRSPSSAAADETPTVPPRAQNPASAAAPSGGGTFQPLSAEGRAQFASPAVVPAPARARVARGAVALIATLCVVGLLLGAAVFVLGRALAQDGYRFSASPPFASKPAPPALPAPPNLRKVDYTVPLLLSPVPVQGGFLALSGSADIAVLTASGQVLHVGPTGKVLSKYPLPPADAADAGSSPNAPVRSTRLVPLLAPIPTQNMHWASDNQGNLYVADAAARTLRQYGANGRFVRAINNGVLAGPEALAVAADGTLFVVDGGRLKAIAVIPPHALPSSAASNVFGN